MDDAGTLVAAVEVARANRPRDGITVEYLTWVHGILLLPNDDDSNMIIESEGSGSHRKDKFEDRKVCLFVYLFVYLFVWNYLTTR